MSKAALIIVDVQNGFLPPDGALAVPKGRDVIPPIQTLLQENWDIIIASQDYHPPGHISFASTHDVEPLSERELTDARGIKYTQTMWPDHCIVGTEGVEIESGLMDSLKSVEDRLRIVRKGWHKGIETYSAFEGYLTDPTTSNDGKPSGTPAKVHSSDTQLAKYLHERGVSGVLVTGLATDFCAGSTAKSALEAGFETAILEPAVRGIKEDGVEKMFEQIEEMGGRVLGRQGDWEAEVRNWMRP